jgi:hypothetical protein
MSIPTTEASVSAIDLEIVLTHFIVSDDVERSRRFYTEVLGLLEDAGGTR